MVQISSTLTPFQGAEQLVLSDNDKQGATSNLSTTQASNMSTEQAAKHAAVEAVVNSVLSEALSNVASVHKPPTVEKVMCP